MSFKIARNVVGMLLLALAGCKTSGTEDSALQSGLGGSVNQWTCRELQTEYPTKRAELVDALEKFKTSYDALQSAGRLAQGERKETQDELALALADDAPSSLIGQGPDDVPALHASMRNFRVEWVFHGVEGKQASGCDDSFGRFGQSSDTQILEQCRLVVRLFNLVTTIKSEYNLGRNGECRTGKASTQGSQTSVRFPYCENACAFGQTNCVKCTYTTSLGSNDYICGEEQDARRAIGMHCSQNGLGCSNVQCTEPRIFNDSTSGTTSFKNSNTRFEAEVDFNQKLNVEVNAGVAVTVNQETHLKIKIDGNVTLKNSSGTAITTQNGGETASTYSCSIGVSAAVVRSIGASVGGGFDLVVVKGSATAGIGANFTALTEYRTTSRDIPMGGATLSTVLLNCARYAKEWGEHDLPALITENVAIKAVAARFMGQEKDALSRDIVGEGIYCATDIAGTFSGTKTYRITKLTVSLQENAITIQSDYDGSINGFDRGTDTTIWENPGHEQYVNVRKKIFDSGPDGLSNEDIRYLLRDAWVSAGKSRYTDCSKTGF